MSHDRLMVALLFVFVPCLVLEWSDGPSPAFAAILARLRHECDPANPEADYYWTQSSMPTERKREAIIEDCRRIGARLLPEVRREMAREMDYEVRGMLIVIAAALGDDAAIEQASRQMAWSEYPAVRISAARTLRRLRDRRTIDWFLTVLQDDHFVVNGACGTLREKFYPVRNIAQMALQEVMAERYPDDDEMRRMSRSINGGPLYEDALERERYIEALMLKAGK
jgi:HEAT repeat protein